MNAAYLKLALCIVFASQLCGCQTTQYSGRRFWMFIPNQRYEAPATGFPAEVLLPDQAYTTNRIAVDVVGAVISPGKILVPEGTTLLQAISYAGGFSSFGSPHRVRVTKISGKSFQPILRKMISEGHIKVWYEIQISQQDILSPKKIPGRAITDYALEDGDRISIPRMIY